MNYLATKNNNEAAKVAAFRKTPYVPWDADEVRETRFGLRVPSIRLDSIKGWRLVDALSIINTLNLRQAIIDKIEASGAPLGLAKLEDFRLGFFEPLPEAHEPRKAAR